MADLKLTRAEISKVQNLMEFFAKNTEQIARSLEKLDLDPETASGQIESGIDEFYRLYSGEVSKQDITARIQETTADMTPLQEYAYLANIVTAISHIGGKMYNDENWDKCLEDHRYILAAIDMGMIEEDNLNVKEALEEMRELVSENIDAFAVLFVDNPDLAELQNACLTEDTAQVQAIAYNTRKAAVCMASAIFVLQERGELPSLADTHYPPEAMGVLAASMLEIDAAQKTGSVDTAKKVFSKAAKAAVTLLVAMPGVVLGMSLFTLIAFMTNLSSVWMIVSGVAIGLNLKAHYDVLKEKLNPVFCFGERILDTTLGAVKPLYAKLSSWIHNTVAPNAAPIWGKCCEFTRNKVLIPAVAFILKTKNFAVKTANLIANKAVCTVEKVMTAAENIVQAAQNRAEENSREVNTVEVSVDASEQEETVQAAAEYVESEEV